MTLDITPASEPPLVHAGLPAELPAATVPPSDKPIAPLDLEESPKLRTKLRLYIILTALYVAYPSLLVFGVNHHLTVSCSSPCFYPPLIRPLSHNRFRQYALICALLRDMFGLAAPTCWPRLLRVQYGRNVATFGAASLCSL
jgi:hypothetical protein